MKKYTEYLTDEELQLLIGGIEEQPETELVTASPFIQERVLERLQPAKQRTGAAEFRLYCFRVVTSAAAAIFLIFLLPLLQQRGILPDGFREGNRDSQRARMIWQSEEPVREPEFVRNLLGDLLGN